MRKKLFLLTLALTTTLGALLTTAPTQAASGCYQVCVPEPSGPCCNTCCRTATGTVCTNRSCP
ncbi:MAG TPA: hypothetical protein VLB76_12740 [Thermoanaerobaculia bacterium]|jgi:hypothetical protein|nr:hypothetical protein [Thermoanaerobaculia bacterium]